MLRTQLVMLIICGAVSERPALMLEAAGVELIPFIAGDVRHVLDAYLQGRPLGTDFRMPGCGKHICCRGKIRRSQEIGAACGNPDRGRAGRMVRNEKSTTSESGSLSPEKPGEMTK